VDQVALVVEDSEAAEAAPGRKLVQWLFAETSVIEPFIVLFEFREQQKIPKYSVDTKNLLKNE